jgi:hypothetical protein
VPHDTRDAVVDYIRDWNSKRGFPVSLLLRWVGIGDGQMTAVEWVEPYWLDTDERETEFLQF